jgi:hypothetical protein
MTTSLLYIFTQFGENILFSRKFVDFQQKMMGKRGNTQEKRFCS